MTDPAPHNGGCELDAFLRAVERDANDLPPAPGYGGMTAMERRARDHYGRAQGCIRCPARAAWAAIADTDEGARWLDLCWGCARWLTIATTDHIHEEITAMEASKS